MITGPTPARVQRRLARRRGQPRAARHAGRDGVVHRAVRLGQVDASPSSSSGAWSRPGRPAYLLDGDNLRHGLNARPRLLGRGPRGERPPGRRGRQAAGRRRRGRDRVAGQPVPRRPRRGPRRAHRGRAAVPRDLRRHPARGVRGPRPEGHVRQGPGRRDHRTSPGSTTRTRRRSHRTCCCARRTATSPPWPRSCSTASSGSMPVTDRSDARLAADLAERAGELLLTICGRAAGCSGKELGKRGDADSNALLLRAAGRGPPGRRRAVRGVGRLPRPAVRRPGVDHRPARRHPRVRHARPRRLGRARRAVGARGAGITAAAVAQPVARRRVRQRRRAQRRSAPSDPPVVPGQRQPPAGVRRRRWPSSSAPGCAPMGSAGAKAMAVLRGEADAYLHAGGQWEWDSAAPVGVVARRRAARLAHRRLAAGLQQRAPVPARPADLPPRARRPAAGGDRGRLLTWTP